LFQAVQEGLKGRFAARTTEHTFFFRRLVTCSLCKYSLIGETQKGHVYYRCHTKDCPTKGIRQEAIEDLISEALQKLQFSEAEKSYLNQATENLKKTWIEEQTRQVTALTARRKQIVERLNRATDAYLDGILEKELFEERKNALMTEERQIDGELERMKDKGSELPVILQKFLELASDTSSLYQMASEEKRRRLLKTLTSNLAFHERTLDFAFVSPFDLVAKRNDDADGRPSQSIARTCDALISAILTKLDVVSSLVTELNPEIE